MRETSAQVGQFDANPVHAPGSFTLARTTLSYSIGELIMSRMLLALLLSTSLCAPFSAWSQSEQESATQLARPQIEKVQLVDVLEAARRNSSKSYLIDHRVQPMIVIGQAELVDIDYSMLLYLLRNNDLAAVTVDDIVNIIPVSIVRQFPLPVLYEEDDSIHDEEWVTWIIQAKNVPPQSIVPIIRPIMPAAGHFAANPGSQSMLLVDRYGNAKRIVALVQQLDDSSPPQN